MLGFLVCGPPAGARAHFGAPTRRPGVAVAPVRCGLPAVALCLWLSVGVCASRPVVMVCALVLLSVVSLPSVLPVSLLVRLSAPRSVWLRLAAAGPARLVVLLVWLLSLVWSLPGRVWPCPPRLLVVLLSVLVLVSLPVAPSFVRARVGPSALPAGWAVEGLLLVPGWLPRRLSRRAVKGGTPLRNSVFGKSRIFARFSEIFGLRRSLRRSVPVQTLRIPRAGALPDAPQAGTLPIRSAPPLRFRTRKGTKKVQVGFPFLHSVSAKNRHRRQLLPAVADGEQVCPPAVAAALGVICAMPACVG